MNYKKFKRYIVVNANRQPMAFSTIDKKGGQFFFCNTEEARRPFALKSYTLKQARDLIKKTLEWRSKKGLESGQYYLMPITTR